MKLTLLLAALAGVARLESAPRPGAAPQGMDFAPPPPSGPKSNKKECFNIRIFCMTHQADAADGAAVFGQQLRKQFSPEKMAKCIADLAAEKKIPGGCGTPSGAAAAIANLVGNAVVDLDRQTVLITGANVTEAEREAAIEDMEEELHTWGLGDVSDAIDTYVAANEEDYVDGEIGIVDYKLKTAVFLKVRHLMQECLKARMAMRGLTPTAEELEEVDFTALSALPDVDGATEIEALTACVHGKAGGKRRKRQIEIANARKWRNNVVNYVFCRSAKEQRKLRDEARRAAKFIQDRTCLTFRERFATDVVVFTTHRPGCVAHVGRQGGPQMINLKHAACHKFSTVAQHWMMALGVRHEVQRTDRDQYVRILEENIEPSKIPAFQISATTTTYGVPYEYQSVMHPVAKAYSKNGENTVEAVLGDEYTATMGSSYGGPTFYDLKLINLHYCPQACPGLTCANDGYRNPNDCDECVCPAGFCGPRCENLCDGGPQTCGGELVAENEWKCINSPNYPEFYAKGQNCAWMIRAPEDHMRVEWKFEGPKFAFAYNSIPVCMNYLELRYQESATRDGQFFCGYDVPSDQILSLRDFIFVNMRNPVREKNYYGFKGCYRISPVTNTPPNPIDCRVEDWTPWSECSVSCNGGVRERTRGVIAGPRYGGKSCAEVGLKEAEGCNPQLCPIDCVVDPSNLYEPWSKCMDSTGQVLQCGKGVQTREQIILVEAENGGAACPVPGPDDLARECDMGSCVVDCELYPLDSPYAWDAFGDCTTTCGPGTNTRRRMIKRQPLNGGKECDQLGEELEDTQPCVGQPECPVDCVLGPWNVGSCDQDCGPGTRTNTREVVTAPAYGGEECGDQVSSSDCNNGPCPIDCQMGEWSDFGPCTADCGGGSQTRSRSVVTRDAYGGEACPVTTDEEAEVRECNTNGCPVDCVISQWTEFSQCDKECGGGKKSRTRTITTSAANGGAQCPDNLEEVEDCNTQGCPVDCEVSAWGPYGDCSKTCGGGFQSRRRTIVKPAANGGQRCPHRFEQQACNEDACPVDCVVGMAAPEGSCSKYCGGGVQVFHWIILTPPANGGKTCEEVIGGPVRYEEECNTKPCPVPCKLNSWGPWEACSAECDGGAQKRYRSIRSQPKYDGTPCDQFGLSEERPCNAQDCLGCEDVVCEQGEYCAERPAQNAVCLCEDNYRRRYGVCEKMECYCPEP